MEICLAELASLAMRGAKRPAEFFNTTRIGVCVLFEECVVTDACVLAEASVVLDACVVLRGLFG